MSTRTGTPQFISSPTKLVSTMNEEMTIVDERDEHILQLQNRLLSMSNIVSSSNDEVSRLRKMNAILLAQANTSKQIATEAATKTKIYKSAAIKMKEKIHRLKAMLKTEKSSTNEQMDFAVEQTKSLLERLFLADARRKDLEIRFGSLARPSTKLRVEMDRHTNSNISSDATDDDSDKSKNTTTRRILHGNIPSGIVIAPEHLHDGRFTPSEPVLPQYKNILKMNQSKSPRQKKIRAVNLVNLPQPFVTERAADSWLTDEESALLSALSSHVTRSAF